MNKILGTFLILVCSGATLADEEDRRGSYAHPLDGLDWYGGINTGYNFADADAEFIGPTNSAYGGSPMIGVDDSGRLSLMFGAATRRGLRIEAELSITESPFDSDPTNGTDDRALDVFRLDGDVESVTLFVNVGYDFDVFGPRITPFVSGGVGASRNRTDADVSVDFDSSLWDGTSFEGAEGVFTDYPSGSTTEFAWNASAGVRYLLTNRLNLRVEYGFGDLGEARTGTNSGDDTIGLDALRSQHLSIGIDYRFR